MATKSEQYRANEQRQSRAQKPKKRRTEPAAGARGRSRTSARIAKKATYALERGQAKRPSRKSTRKSAHRSKTDAGLVGREELRTTSPEARFARSRARAKGVKGRTSPR
jgi:hypothetical protein